MTASDHSATPRTRSGLRRRLVLPYAVLVLVIVLWSIYWVVARQQLVARLADARTAAMADGLSVACSDESIGGFPFRFEFRCAEASVFDAASQTSVKIPDITGVALAYKPHHVIVEASGPAAYSQPGGAEATLTWDSLRTSVQLGMRAMQRASLVAEGATLSLTPAGASPVSGKAEDLQIHLRQAGTSDPSTGRQDLDVALSADGLTVDGEPGVWSAKAMGTMHAAPLVAEDAGEFLRAWQAGDGRLSVDRLTLTDGKTEITGSGAFSASPDGLLNGDLVVGIAGSEPPASPDDMTPVEIVIGYLNMAIGIFGQTRTIDGAEIQTVDVSVDKGLVTFGGLNVATLKPLF